MQSDGGLADIKAFSGFRAVLSGPAGGFVGFSRTTCKLAVDMVSSKQLTGAERAREIRVEGKNRNSLQVIGFDMGGA